MIWWQLKKNSLTLQINLMPAFTKVLFIDDDIITIRIYERLFKFMDFAEEFIAKRDGEQAKDYLLSNKFSIPDVIFVDLYMSVMSGSEFLEWFEKWCRIENIDVPVYVLSSSMSKDDFDQACAHKVNGYIVKPMTAAHLNEIASKYAE